MRNIIVIVLSMFVSNAFALAFHYDNVSVELTTIKHTSPALHILDNGILYYGALFSVNDYTVPPNVVHIMQPDGSEYFLAPWCDAGQYPSPETNQCIPCGYGHYCTGGHHRESCTYGAIACNGNNFTYDPPMPTGTNGMYNRALTMAEVNQYVPQTDISQYEAVFAGETSATTSVAGVDCGDSPDDPRLAVLDQTIPHGTYVVIHEYWRPGIHSEVSSRSDFVSSAYIVVFDHDVVYRPIHMCSYFYNFFDTTHVPYESYTLVIPNDYYNTNENITNVNNISGLITEWGTSLYHYKLK